jgi:hypothetical protein
MVTASQSNGMLMYEAVSLISGTGAVIFAAVITVQIKGRW